MRRVSKLSLLSELRRLLSRPDTRVVARKLKICGHSTWGDDCDKETGPRDIVIVYDPRRDGRVRIVIHELLHVWLDWYLGAGYDMTYELEEAMICSLEDRLYAYLHDPKHEKLLESWNKAIERKTR